MDSRESPMLIRILDRWSTVESLPSLEVGGFSGHKWTPFA